MQLSQRGSLSGLTTNTGLVLPASGVASLRQHQACVGGEAVRPKRDPLWLTCSDVASLRQHQACVGGEAVRPERDPLCLTCSDVASLRQHQACVGGEAGKRSSLA